MTIANTLLAWYKVHGRDLPWRKTRDPYKILISEVMLQQTQVSRVIEYYERWLQRFPDWVSLASAKTDEVIQAWSGLGYNRRGLMLRAIAQQIVIHGQPKSAEDWQTLKGIGPYTAAAIGTFALKERILPIDTNIRRVLGRFLLGLPFPQLTDDEHIREATKDFLPTTGNYYDVPQAVFDLATSICAKSPQCATCPLREQCKSAELFLTSTVTIPKRTIKQANEKKQTGKPHPDRIYRGRILKALKESKQGLSLFEIARIVDQDYQEENDKVWIENMLNRMKKDGFLEEQGQKWKISS
ncbi:A/G-specific adenine glycosylase [Patescibacteria group bacterium]|nr:A/G-specific adenine glycosylase [Patescibacteria group bacterium]